MKQLLTYINEAEGSKIINAMKNALKDVGALNDTRAAAIDAKEFNFPFSVIEDQVQKSTVITGDAVLNFANRVSEAVKRYFIQMTDAWKVEQKSTLEQVAAEAAAPQCRQQGYNTGQTG